MDFPLFETICIEQGQIKNIALHQQRYEQSLSSFYAQSAVNIFDLLQLIHNTSGFSSALSMKLVRCRIMYNQYTAQVHFFPYQRRVYHSFQPIIYNDIDYSLKYNNRDLLTKLFSQRKHCDEIIIIKQGKATDCSLGNLVFRQNARWFTPDSPLLNGTQRQKLLIEGKISEKPIFIEDIEYFDEIRVINAMNDLAD